MSRVKLTEYRAKKLLLGDAYQGVRIVAGANVYPADGLWVIKVDQGVKKRMKQGLVKVKQEASMLAAITKEWEGRGFTSFIAEPFLAHEESEEQYLSLERVRDGIRLLHAAQGGIEIEAHPEKVANHLIRETTDVAAIAVATGLPEVFLAKLVDAFEKNFLGFLEINPLVVKDGEAHLLDAAALADDAGMYFVRGAWGSEDIAEAAAKHEAEANVAALQKTTPASLKLKVLNPDGSLFFLLSGGGGSIVIADQAALRGAGKELGNYGEYSGGPTREETHLYAREVLSLLLASKASKKALVIAGGVANFTDIRKTFAGVVDALGERSEELRQAGVKVYVRRGGPNEKAGLAHMEEYLRKEGLLGSVHGSDAVITAAVDEAITAVLP